MKPPVFRVSAYNKSTLCALVAQLLAVACVPAGDSSPVTRAGDVAPLLNAQRSFARPEVGQIQLGNSSCTATLIDPQTLITAAHCVNYQAAAPNGRRGSFTVELAADDSRSYVVQGWQPLSTNQFSSDLDVGLVRLMTPVPAAVAIPAALSNRSAQNGEGITIYGYGCTTRTNGVSFSSAKRVYSGAYNATKNLCSGDSGGPVFLTADGSLAYVNSGYIIGRGDDLFGQVVPQRSNIQNVVAQWDAAYGRANAATVEVKNETGARLVVRCDAPAQVGECDDWQFFEAGDRKTLNTYGGYLSLYNVDLGASVRFEHYKVQATSAAVAVRPSRSATLVAIPATGGGGGGSQDGGTGGGDAGTGSPDAGTGGSDTGVGVDSGTGGQDSGNMDAGSGGPDAGVGADSGSRPDVGGGPADAGSGLPDLGTGGGVPDAGHGGGGNSPCIGGPTRSQSHLMASRDSGEVCAARPAWFRISLQRFEFIEIQINFSHAAGDIDAKLVDASGQLLAFSAGRDNQEIVRHVSSEAGDVYLKIYGFQDASAAIQSSLYQDAQLQDSDGDRVPDALDLCDNTPSSGTPWMSGQYIGCSGGQYMDRIGPQDADGDGVEDYQDRCSGTASGAAIWLKPEYLGCAGGQTLDR